MLIVVIVAVVFLPLLFSWVMIVSIAWDIREVLGVSNGDHITFVVGGNTVRIMNSAVYAMQMLQTQMKGQAEEAGLTSDDDIMALVKEVRAESDGE